jgi:glycosyltransferase involved in cell wall biosynthesis
VLRIGALVAREMPVRLVLVGPAPTATLRCLAEDLGVAAGVDWRCEVSDADLQDLYRQAAVFLFPSRYEGFGWPPLEAMACGCPVVCSNAASLPEVVGDAALTAAPEDYEQLARYCLDLLRQPDLRADLVRRGFANLERFTLRRFGDQLAAVYAAALGPG